MGLLQQVALPAVAMVAGQEGTLLLGLHALSNHASLRLLASATTVRAIAASLGSVSQRRAQSSGRF